MNKFRKIFIVFAIIFCGVIDFLCSKVKRENKDIRVTEIKFAENIENRYPKGASKSFLSTIKKVYCWTKILAKEYPSEIYHVWYYGCII